MAARREFEIPPYGSSDARWGVEAVLRQGLASLERGEHVALVVERVQRALRRWAGEREREATATLPEEEQAAARERVREACRQSPIRPVM